MSKRISIEELVATGFVNKVLTAPSGRVEDSAGFLGRVLEEVEERMGGHLTAESLLRIKRLIRAPERDVLERVNLDEAFLGVQGFLEGLPQREFLKVASGEKRHKL